MGKSFFQWFASDIDTLIQKKAVGKLIKIAYDKARPLCDRNSAISALGEIKAYQALDSLLSLAGDPEENREIRENAVLSLGEIADTSSAEPLISLAKGNEDNGLLPVIISALGKIATQGAVEFLIRCLDREFGRNEAIEALGKIGDTRAIDPLIHCLRDKEKRTRALSATVLGKFHDAGADKALRKARDEEQVYYVRWDIERALGERLSVEETIEHLNRKP